MNAIQYRKNSYQMLQNLMLKPANTALRLKNFVLLHRPHQVGEGLGLQPMEKQVTNEQIPASTSSIPIHSTTKNL